MINIIKQLESDEEVLKDALENSKENIPDISLSGRELDLATKEAEYFWGFNKTDKEDWDKIQGFDNAKEDIY